ncbi:hypothetical protein PAXRUDRAFT_828814, partial [Paxillus rubicundulus Ve08.2h10]
MQGMMRSTPHPQLHSATTDDINPLPQEYTTDVTPNPVLYETYHRPLERCTFCLNISPISTVMSSVSKSGNYSAPRHQLHDSPQPLPGLNAPGPAQTQGYPPELTERLPVSDPACPTQQRTGHVDSEDLTNVQCAEGPGGFAAQNRGRGQNAFNAERPLGVAPTPEGGVAIDGRTGLPEGRAGLGDKIVGKTQKVSYP